MRSQQFVLFCYFLITFTLPMNSKKLKTYNFNKYSQSDAKMDCLETKRDIPIPMEFTICFRHKKLFSPGNKHGLVSIGDVAEDGGLIGFIFGYWSWVPWAGAFFPSGHWIGLGDEFDSNFYLILLCFNSLLKYLLPFCTFNL